MESCLPSERMCSYTLCTPKALPKKNRVGEIVNRTGVNDKTR